MDPYWPTREAARFAEDHAAHDPAWATWRMDVTEHKLDITFVTTGGSKVGLACKKQGPDKTYCVRFDCDEDAYRTRHAAMEKVMEHLCAIMRHEFAEARARVKTLEDELSHARHELEMIQNASPWPMN